MPRSRTKFRRSIDVLIVGLLVIAAATVSHFVITDRLGVLRAIYPVEALLARQAISCSTDAPVWMRTIMVHAVDVQKALGNQLAYVAPDGQLHHCEGGWQEGVPWSARIDIDDRFRYASLTKVVTADAVMRALTGADHSLDAKLVDFIPEAVDAADPRVAAITIEQLLRHAAGFDRLRSSDSVTVHKETPWCPYAPERLQTLKLDFAPGERQAYSNLGYCLLGLVVERATAMPFRQYLDAEYGLAQRGIRFIDGPYLSDEVRYDFRNSGFYGESYYRYFDFNALASSAGLSGSASALAQLVREMVSRKPLNLLSAVPDEQCDESVYNRCFGFAFSRFRQPGQQLVLNVQSGLLYGASSKLVVDGYGGVTVWVGNGMSLPGDRGSAMFVYALYELLNDFYRTAASP